MFTYRIGHQWGLKGRLYLWVFLISCNQGFAQSPVVSPTLERWTLAHFIRPAKINPVINPDSTVFFEDPMTGRSVAWEADHTFNPAATLKDGKIILLYRAEDKSGGEIGMHTSRIGYAESTDGFHFKRFSQPVLFPDTDGQKSHEWPGGCEDPRVAMTVDGLYVMLYTQWNRQVARIAVATSRDLKHWEKHGPAFRQAYGGKFSQRWSKSASLVTGMKDGKWVIARIQGKYWMYWGEQHIYAATSNDLVNWKPLIDAKGELKALASPRKGYFDSELTECGPPAIMTSKGILLLYNGKNAPGSNGDTAYEANSYCAGQILFDRNDPEKVIARLNMPFFYPTEPFERMGQYAAGTVFTEGLVYFKQKWFLYYGCADSRVAVAVLDPALK